MKYIDVKWLHSNAEYPIRLVSELDTNGYENRKMEFFSNGQVSYASKSSSSGDTALSEEPIPSLAEINSQKEFQGLEINSESFEKLWSQYVGNDA